MVREGITKDKYIKEERNKINYTRFKGKEVENDDEREEGG